MTKEAQPSQISRTWQWQYEILNAKTKLEAATTNDDRVNILRQAKKRADNLDKSLKPAPARGWKRFYNESLIQLAQLRGKGDKSIKAFLALVDGPKPVDSSVVTLEFSTTHGPQRFTTPLVDLIEVADDKFSLFTTLVPFDVG